MSRDKAKDKKDSKRKKKYTKPRINRRGSLQDIAERVTGAICCVSQRAKRSLHSARERRSLLRDVGLSLSAR